MKNLFYKGYSFDIKLVDENYKPRYNNIIELVYKEFKKATISPDEFRQLMIFLTKYFIGPNHVYDIIFRIKQDRSPFRGSTQKEKEEIVLLIQQHERIKKDEERWK